MDKPTIIDGNLFVDDRGYLSFVNNFNFDGVKRFYVVENHEVGFIRAWHGHKKEKKYVYVINGCAKIFAIPLEILQKAKDTGTSCYKDEELFSATLTSKKPTIVCIPEGYANGFITLEENTKIIFFSSCSISDSIGDDYRFEYNIINPWNVEYR